MKDKISIIVPIYNTDKYLAECIESIINQTYKNLEIILINDGSSDKSLEICNYFKEKDRRIVVINQVNMGVAYSRNIGIKNATGDYIAFVDSDDKIKPNMFQKLIEISKKNNADISMCEFEVIDEKGNNINNELKKKYVEKEFENTINVLKGDRKFEILYKGSITGLAGIVIWNKLYKRKLIKSLKYKDGTIHEDEAMSHIILNRANMVVYTKETLYLYRKRQGSITSKEYSIDRQQILDGLNERYIFFKDTNREKLACFALKEYAFMIIIHYRYSLEYNLGNGNLKNLKKRLKKILKDIFFNKYLSLRVKVIISLFYMYPKLAIKIYLLKGNLSLYN